MQKLAQIVETGPDLEGDGVVRWRRIDLVRVIEERFGVVERTTNSVYLARPERDFINPSVRMR